MKEYLCTLVFLGCAIFSGAQFDGYSIVFVQRMKKSTNADKTYTLLLNQTEIGKFRGISGAFQSNYDEKWMAFPAVVGQSIIRIEDHKRNTFGEIEIPVAEGEVYFIEFDASAGYGISPVKLLPIEDGHARLKKANMADVSVFSTEIKSEVTDIRNQPLMKSKTSAANHQPSNEAKEIPGGEPAINIASKQRESLADKPSDVDINIPVNKERLNRYALIIGNEDYSTYQSSVNTEINVDYAVHDAMVFREYALKTLGIPEKQIRYLKNATLGQMNQGLAWISNLAKVENGNAELFFYYSGHGLPDEVSREPYLIPVDVSGSNLTDGVQLSTVYKRLSENPSARVTLIIDACFSGGARNQGLVAMKGIKIKPTSQTLMANMVQFNSSSGEESSAVYREKQHGFLTYFLLKKLQETKGKVSYEEMAEYVKSSVQKEAALFGKSQTPGVIFNSEIEEIWGDWKFY
jgi:hypothetical protein